MARRHNTRSRCRRTEWKAAARATVFENVAAVQVSTVTLIDGSLEESPTLVRIVGSIAILPQTFNANFVAHWGVRLFQSANDDVQDPGAANYLESEDVMFWQAVYGSAGSAGANGTSFAIVTIPVDIRVMRKVNVEQEVRLTVSSAVAFSVSRNLRALLMHA